jgi:hypothetical protein
MKHLKKFENFYLSPDVDSDEQEFIDYSKKLRSTSSEVESDFDSDEELLDVMPDEISSEEGDWDREDTFASDEEEGDFNREDLYDSSEEEEGDNFIKRFDEAKKSKTVSYKKSGLKKPELADRNKNKKIEGWEKAIAKKIEKSMENKKK